MVAIKMLLDEEMREPAARNPGDWNGGLREHLMVTHAGAERKTGVELKTVRFGCAKTVA
jgi:hypothetical protein